MGAGCRYGISTRVLPRLLIMDIEKEYYLPVPVDIKVSLCVCVCRNLMCQCASGFCCMYVCTLFDGGSVDVT
jgi:hypothetical protein